MPADPGPDPPTLADLADLTTTALADLDHQISALARAHNALDSRVRLLYYQLQFILAHTHVRFASPTGIEITSLADLWDTHGRAFIRQCQDPSEPDAYPADQPGQRKSVQ